MHHNGVVLRDGAVLGLADEVFDGQTEMQERLSSHVLPGFFGREFVATLCYGVLEDSAHGLRVTLSCDKSRALLSPTRTRSPLRVALSIAKRAKSAAQTVVLVYEEVVPGVGEVEGWWSPPGRCLSGIVREFIPLKS